jgi:hypothetical protein
MLLLPSMRGGVSVRLPGVLPGVVRCDGLIHVFNSELKLMLVTYHK